MEVDNGLAGLLASIGLLVASVAELLVSGYSCLTLTPKLCGCLRASTTDEMMIDGHLKTRNMVHQWVVTQNHMPAKSPQPPVYLVHPMPVPIHPMIQVCFGFFLHNFNSCNYSLLGQNKSTTFLFVLTYLFFFLFFHPVSLFSSPPFFSLPCFLPCLHLLSLHSLFLS